MDISPICQKATVRVCGAWLRIYHGLCSKHLAHLVVCSGSPLVRDCSIGTPAFVNLAYSAMWYTCVYFIRATVLEATKLGEHHNEFSRGCQFHYVNFAMRWGTASKTASRWWAIPKRGSVLNGHWIGHLLSYSLSGGHDGAMLPIYPRGLNGPLTSHFIFFYHMYFSLNTPTYYWYQMPN